MLPYAHLLSNGTSVPHGTHGVDMPGYHRTHLCSTMRHTYYSSPETIGHLSKTELNLTYFLFLHQP